MRTCSENAGHLLRMNPECNCAIKICVNLISFTFSRKNQESFAVSEMMKHASGCKGVAISTVNL